VAVLVVTAPVWVESNSSCNWFGSEADRDELLMRGGETTSLRIATIEEGETDETKGGVEARKNNGGC
jgi:hypothetical protein